MGHHTERIDSLAVKGAISSGSLAVAGAISNAGVALTSSFADLNALAGVSASGSSAKRIVKVPLGVGAGAGGSFAWANPEAAPIVVNRVTLDVTTIATGAGTISVGQAANGTTSSANLIDTLDVHSAAGTFDNITDGGTNGKARARLGATDFVTGSKASGSLAGLVGNAYIEYFLV